MSESITIGFICRWVANDIDEKIRARSRDGTRIYQLNCLANLTPNMVLDAFQGGADAVFLLRCGNGDCKYFDGDQKVDNLQSGLEAMMEDLGLETERLLMSNAEDFEEDPVGRMVTESRARVKDLGPNPYRSEDGQG
jgi:coenzyme F420-reducing hydrogenase delta subunit